MLDKVEVFPKCRPKEQTRLYRKQFVRCGLRLLRVFLGQSGMVRRKARFWSDVWLEGYGPLADHACSSAHSRGDSQIKSGRHGYSHSTMEIDGIFLRIFYLCI